MNILFLDCDGVLNSKQHFLMLQDVGKSKTKEDLKNAGLEFMILYTDAKNVWCLKYILDNVIDLKIVISSSWRNHFEIEQFKELFRHYRLDGERIIDKTDCKLSSYRCNEIRWWLEDNPTDKWITLDDHVIFDFGSQDKEHEILTDPWNGLTMAEAFKIIKYFKPDFKEPSIAI